MDIVERLRGCMGCQSGDPECNCSEAAAEIERLRSALERIKTLKPLDPDGGGWGDPYYEMCISHIGIATEALNGPTGSD